MTAGVPAQGDTLTALAEATEFVEKLLFAAALGALVGVMLAVPASRRGSQFLLAALAGAAGSCLWVLKPLLLNGGAIGGDPKFMAACAALTAGVAILLMRPHRHR